MVETHARDELARARDLLRRHLREVLALKNLVLRHGQAVIKFELRAFELVGLALEHRVGKPRGARRRLGFFRVGRLGHRRHHRDELVDETATAPENIERLLEDQRLLMLLHEDRAQRGAKIDAIADTRGVNRAHRVNHAARPHRQAGGAQGAREIKNVLGQPARALRRLGEREIVSH